MVSYVGHGTSVAVCVELEAGTHPRSQRRIAHVRNNIFGKRVRTDAHGDPGFEILIEGFHGDAELQILKRAIGNGSAGVGNLREVNVTAEHFDRIAQQAMATPWVPRNPRKIEGPAQVREILDMAA